MYISDNIVSKENLISTSDDLKKFEKACRIVADTLSLLEKHIVEGIETLELDKIAEDFIRSNNAKPAFKGYQVDGKVFPNTLCISINETVVHGIPSKRKLKAGDVVSIDCGVKYEGFFGDSALTVAVGEIDEVKKKLLKVTEESLYIGIEQAFDKSKVYNISRVIQNYVESNGFSLTKELTGHGIGKRLHQEPSIPNFVPPLLHRNKYPNMKLVKGMGLAIEPMVHAGKQEVEYLNDGWTVVTVDRSPAAHFEHTVLVDEKPIILTLRN
ncbi:MAG: type I methionyl aminopeptidase [Candidatus Kapabacteria bacterium]|nr:type I methionyl aminopeptidase [Candidatus Kapabacteria bacterium]